MYCFKAISTMKKNTKVDSISVFQNVCKMQNTMMGSIDVCFPFYNALYVINYRLPNATEIVAVVIYSVVCVVKWGSNHDIANNVRLITIQSDVKKWNVFRLHYLLCFLFWIHLKCYNMNVLTRLMMFDNIFVPFGWTAPLASTYLKPFSKMTSLKQLLLLL